MKNKLDSQQKSTLRNYALAIGLCVVVVVAANLLFKVPTPVEDYLEKLPDRQEVLSLFQSKAQLATTEVKLRRMGIYDSDTKIATVNPASWKLGRRACIMPVDITIKYGIDLRKKRSQQSQGQRCCKQEAERFYVRQDPLESPVIRACNSAAIAALLSRGGSEASYRTGSPMRNSWRPASVKIG